MESGSAGMLSVLLSGLIASIVASGVALLFSFWFERFRHRQAVAIEVLELTDGITNRYLHVMFGADITFPPEHRAQQIEHLKNAQELLVVSTQDSIAAKVHFAFGDGRASQLLTDLLSAYADGAQIAADVPVPGGSPRGGRMETVLQNRIGPLRRELVELLVERAQLPASWIEIDAALTRKRLG